MGYTFENDTNEKGAAVACGKAGNTIEGRCDEHDDMHGTDDGVAAQ